MDVQVIDALDVLLAAMVGFLEKKGVVVGLLEVVDELVLCSKRPSDVALEDPDVARIRSPSWTRSSYASP